MKKLLFLLLLPFLSWGQSSDATLSTQNTNEIRNKVYSSGRAADMFGGLISSKASLLGSYSNPAWITALDWTKLSSIPSSLTTIGGLTLTNDNILQIKAGAWTGRTIAQYKSDLALTLVENTALSTWAGSTNLTTLGTVTTGAWSGTAIGAIRGGTGQTTVTTGDLLYGSASNTWGKLGAGTVGYVLTSGGAGVAPSWSAAAGGGTWGSIAGTFTNQTDANNRVKQAGVNENLRTLQIAGDVTHVSSGINQIVDVGHADGRQLAVISRFGSSFSDFSVFDLVGAFTYDGGQTLGTPFIIVTGTQGSNFANAIPSVKNLGGGNLEMLFWTQVNETNPIPTLVRRTASSDYGTTWTTPTTVYTVGTYSAPHGGRIFTANDGVLWYPTAVWTGGAGGSPTDYDYSSQVGNYKAKLLKKTAGTWAVVAALNIVADNTAIFEPGLFQLPDDADGTPGRVYLYYRSRGGYVGLAYSDDNFVTWTVGTASPLVGSNHDTHMLYIPENDVLIAATPAITPWEGRKINLQVSYDRGTTWFQKLNVNTVGAGGYYTAIGMPSVYKGQLLIGYISSNLAATIYDSYTINVPLSSIVGINQHAFINGITQSLNGTTHIVTGGGMIFDDLVLGNVARRDAGTTLQITNPTVNMKPTVEIWDDKANANTQAIIRRLKSRGGSSPSTNDFIGLDQWWAGAGKTEIHAQYNVDGLVDLKYLTDATGGGVTTKTVFTPTGTWLYGGALAPRNPNNLAEYKSTGKNTEKLYWNSDANSNYSIISGLKLRGSSYDLTTGDKSLLIDFNQYTGGVGAAIWGEANGNEPGGYTNMDIKIGTTNSSGVSAERWSFTGNGDFRALNVGQRFIFTEGSGGFTGQTTLVSGTKAITISGVTTSSRCMVTLAAPGSASLTVQYQCACTSNTITIQANVAATTINVSDVSVLNYWVFN